MSTQKFPWLAQYQEGVNHNLNYPEISLSQMLEETVAKNPEQTALVFQGVQLSYRVVLSMVNRLATGLSALGVHKGERVAIMLPNCPQWVVSYFAVLKLGAIVVQTNPMYMERELEYQLKNSEAKTIIVYDALFPRVNNVRSRTNLENVITVSLGEPVKCEDTLAFETILKDYQPNPPSVEISPRQDIAVLQYTGGTTGTAKGVMLTHFNLVANAYQVRYWMPMVAEGQERILTVLPLFHVYALTACNNLSVLLGGAQYLVPKFDIDVVLKVINDFKPTIFPGAPTLYIAIVNHPKLSEYDIRSIKVCISGSAPLPVEVAERFHELTGGLLVEAYGLSESSPATHLNPVNGKARVGSIGLPCADTEAKIVDLETGTVDLPSGEVGELLIRGPQVMLGYWNLPNETASTLRDGWLYTGDIAKMDEDGFFYIVDRKKDMIIAGGFNIYPRDIEEVLYEHPKVKEAIVIGVPDAYRGETVKAFVVLRDGETCTSEELVNYCRQKLAAYKVPKLVEFRDSLPKTAVGKILRRTLQEQEQTN
ncbi:MAG: long-chain fatty acid--CoA ligase, partial [Peptococcaceae bacterium]|nr:long-chain fatty acid--CoA ligase [Peptococcaceae bacterium]